MATKENITHAKLAEKIGIKPISFSQAIARNNFDMNYLKRIADALGVGVADLFGATIICPKCGHEIKIKVE